MFAKTHRTCRKICLLTKALPPKPTGGRELLCKVNQDALQAIYADSVILFELVGKPLNRARDRINAFRGYIDGVNATTIDSALMLIDRASIKQVFVDGSNLGALVASIKQRMPHVEITTFFHNVEARFFWGALRLHKSWHALGVFIANYLAERKAVKYSDKLVCLSERDSYLLNKIYGRKATYIAPMALADQCPASFLNAAVQAPGNFAIFVGGTFYANREGIAWFVREVVPKVDIPLFVLGHGFETLRALFEIPGKVTVIGGVDSLADWYRRAQFVIAPIFDGSGMKTKVAEALMYGKKIIGTPEAFSGYEDIVEQAGWVCETPEEFVAAFEKAKVEVTQSFNPVLRKLYEQRYSMEAAQQRLMQILG